MWADENRVLPPGSAEPGPWRSVRTPYLIPIMQAASDLRFRRIVGVMGTQMGKTELLLNLIGHRLDDDPAPIIFVAASQRQVEAISTSRVAKMIRSTPSLDAKLDKRKTANKVTEKIIAGQRLGFAWAGSAIELSSHPCAMVLLDERDRMDADVGGEGDPVTLAEARTATYPDGKVVVTSTPTLDGGSPIWALYDQGTRCRWSWPCPDCSEYFVPSFELLKWAENATPSQAKRTARLMCPHCSALIDDKHRAAMNAKGRYETTGDPDSDAATFWVSGLASPWRSWGDCARSWIEAVRSGESSRMQAVINTVFGELFRLRGDAPESAAVEGLRGGYHIDECPKEARVITAGVDLQADRLVYAIRAWGERSTSWLLRHGEVYGDTTAEPVWLELAELLAAEWAGRQIRLMLVDSGYRPEAAYAFARRFPGRVLPSKGHESQAKPVSVTALDTTTKGKTAIYTTRLAHVDAGYFKAWVHGRIAWPLDQPGAWRLPTDATDDYCAQIVAESRVTKPSGRIVWVRTSKANHYLDCEALNAAAAHLLGVQTLVKRKAAAQEATASTLAKPKPQGIRPWPRRRGWVGSW